MASHDFISILRNKHSFNLTVFGFSLSTSFFVNIKQKIKLTITSMSLSTDWATSLKVKKPLFTFVNSLIKLKISPTLSLSVKRPRLVFIMRQLMKITQTINVTKPTIVFILHSFEKIAGWVLHIPKVGIVFSPITAKFHALWEYDNQTLAALDNTTLTDLDYSVV
jgi:hypothetical protein